MTKPLQAASLSLGSIVCDAPGCDYVDTSSTLETVINGAGTTCPKCGAVTITEDDAEMAKSMLAMTEAINAFVGEIKDDGKKRVLLKTQFRIHDGEIVGGNFTVKPAKPNA